MGFLRNGSCHALRYGGTARNLLLRRVPVRKKHFAAPSRLRRRNKRLLLYAVRTATTAIGRKMLRFAGNALPMLLRRRSNGGRNPSESRFAGQNAECRSFMEYRFGTSQSCRCSGHTVPLRSLEFTAASCSVTRLTVRLSELMDCTSLTFKNRQTRCLAVRSNIFTERKLS